jgi:hypothetical protein
MCSTMYNVFELCLLVGEMSWLLTSDNSCPASLCKVGCEGLSRAFWAWQQFMLEPPCYPERSWAQAGTLLLRPPRIVKRPANLMVRLLRIPPLVVWDRVGNPITGPSTREECSRVLRVPRVYRDIRADRQKLTDRPLSPSQSGVEYRLRTPDCEATITPWICSNSCCVCDSTLY